MQLNGSSRHQRHLLLRFAGHAAFVVFVLAGPRSALAQDVSLLADDTIDDIKVTSGGSERTVTVVRDAYNPNQWYYIPTRPRLVEPVNSGRKEPLFHLYRYQFEDPGNKGQLLEGGFLQFTASLSLDSSATDELKKKILDAKKDIDPNKFALSALRMRTAHAQLYSPGATGVFVRTPPDGNGDAPRSPSAEPSFRNAPETRAEETDAGAILIWSSLPRYIMS
jgi:hypothetical protein